MKNAKSETPTDRVVIRSGATLDVPPEVRLCPYCGGKLAVSFSAWTQQNNGEWCADGVELDCTTEPELPEGVFEDDPTSRWYEWLMQHSDMPYVYWLPATVEVEKWVNKTYRFDPQDFDEERLPGPVVGGG
jgi:hypothetical protein